MKSNCPIINKQKRESPFVQQTIFLFTAEISHNKDFLERIQSPKRIIKVLGGENHLLQA